MNHQERRIDAAAQALRALDMAGRITRPWEKVPNYDKKKWRVKAQTVLDAAEEYTDKHDETAVI